LTIALYAEQPFSLVILTVSSIHTHSSAHRHIQEPSTANRHYYYLTGAIGPLGNQVLYLAREAVHDKSLHIVIDSEPPALGVRVGLDERGQLRGAPSATAQRSGSSRRVTPADALARSPLGTIPMRAPTNAPSGFAWRSQNPMPRH